MSTWTWVVALAAVWAVLIAIALPLARRRPGHERERWDRAMAEQEEETARWEADKCPNEIEP
jgi:hypothetical protein